MPRLHCGCIPSTANGIAGGPKRSFFSLWFSSVAWDSVSQTHPKSGGALGTFGTSAIVSAGEKSLMSMEFQQGRLWLLLSVFPCGSSADIMKNTDD